MFGWSLEGAVEPFWAFIQTENIVDISLRKWINIKFLCECYHHTSISCRLFHKIKKSFHRFSQFFFGFTDPHWQPLSELSSSCHHQTLTYSTSNAKNNIYEHGWENKLVQTTLSTCRNNMCIIFATFCPSQFYLKGILILSNLNLSDGAPHLLLKVGSKW